MPTVIATLPSNGTVALNSAATAPPAVGGNAFRDVLLALNTGADQTADASVAPAAEPLVPDPGTSSQPPQETPGGLSLPTAGAADAAAATPAGSIAGAPTPAANSNVPISVRPGRPIPGARSASAKGSRTAQQAPTADPDPPVTPPAASVIPLVSLRPIAQAEPFRAGYEGPAIVQHALGSTEVVAAAAAGAASMAGSVQAAAAGAASTAGSEANASAAVTSPAGPAAHPVTGADGMVGPGATAEPTADPPAGAASTAQSHTATDIGDPPPPPDADLAALSLALPAVAATPARDQPNVVSPAAPAANNATPATPKASSDAVQGDRDQPKRAGAGPAASGQPQTLGDATTAADRLAAVPAAKAIQKNAPRSADRPVLSVGTEASTRPAIAITPILTADAAAAAATPATTSSNVAGTPASPATTSSTNASMRAASAEPAAQVAPAILTLGQASDGSRQMTLRLHPAELGTVQVQIGRSETGAARVDITVEKTGTLQALMRDQPELHRALDDAGVPAAGRTITFHTAPASAAPGGSELPSQTASHGGSGNIAGNGAFGGGRSGYAESGRGGDPSGTQGRAAAAKAAPVRSAAYRVGLDIVA